MKNRSKKQNNSIKEAKKGRKKTKFNEGKAQVVRTNNKICSKHKCET